MNGYHPKMVAHSSGEDRIIMKERRSAVTRQRAQKLREEEGSLLLTGDDENSCEDVNTWGWFGCKLLYKFVSFLRPVIGGNMETLKH